MMNNFHLIRPFWLLAFIPLVLLGWRLWLNRNTRARAEKMIAPHLLDHLVLDPNGRSGFRPIHSLLLLWAIAVLAAVGPSWKQQPNPLTEDEAGLYVLLEVSGSMMATDVLPSRLERAKHKLSDLLDARKGSPTGLIVYSGSAHLVMPPTTDGRIIMQMVEELEPEMMPSQGVALASALRLAERMFERSDQPGSVVIFTDGIEPNELADTALPIQILAFAPLALDLRAPVVTLTVDDSDVQQVAKRAATALSIRQADTMNVRWQDAGVYLLPLLLILSLLPFRKGWVVE